MMDIHRAFEQFLRFEVSLAELRARLGPGWRFQRDGHGFALSGDLVLDRPIEVDFEHVTAAIDRVLQNERSPIALEEWANLLLLSDVYAIAPSRDDAERERLLQCIHQLASPSIFGDLDAEHLLEIRRIVR